MERAGGSELPRSAARPPKTGVIPEIGDYPKEADETRHWPELPVVDPLVPARRPHPPLEEANELPAILTAMSKRSKGLE